MSSVLYGTLSAPRAIRFLLISNPGSLFSIIGNALYGPGIAGTYPLTIQSITSAGPITQQFSVTYTPPLDALLANNGQPIFSTGTTPILVE